MGQYFVLADHTRKEYVSPHTVGDMYKQPEIVMGTGNLNKLTLFLITDGRIDGGAIRGRWAGDYVTLVGDYRHSAPTTELPKSKYPSWEKIHDTYKDVGREVIEEFNAWCDAMGAPEEMLPFYPPHNAPERAALKYDPSTGDERLAYYPVGETEWSVAGGRTGKWVVVRGPRPNIGRYAYLHATYPAKPGTPLPTPSNRRTKLGARMAPDLILTARP